MLATDGRYVVSNHTIDRSKATMAKATNKATAAATTTQTAAERVAAAIAAEPRHGFDTAALTAQFAAHGWKYVNGRGKSMKFAEPLPDAKPSAFIVLAAYAGRAAELELVKRLWKFALANDVESWNAAFDEFTGYTGLAAKRFTADDNVKWARIRQHGSGKSQRQHVFVLPCCPGKSPSGGELNNAPISVETKVAGIDADDFESMLS